MIKIVEEMKCRLLEHQNRTLTRELILPEVSGDMVVKQSDLSVSEKLLLPLLWTKVREIKEVNPEFESLIYSFEQFDYGYSVLYFQLTDRHEELFCYYKNGEVTVFPSDYESGCLLQLEQELKRDQFLLKLMKGINYIPLTNQIVGDNIDFKLWIYPLFLRIQCKEKPHDEYIYPILSDLVYATNIQNMDPEVTSQVKLLDFELSPFIYAFLINDQNFTRYNEEVTKRYEYTKSLNFR